MNRKLHGLRIVIFNSIFVNCTMFYNGKRRGGGRVGGVEGYWGGGREEGMFHQGRHYNRIIFGKFPCQ